MTVKAIDTIYKGYRFRSRLEARWAVFFDHLGLQWVYEDEGFELPSGWYLPDFYFPKDHMWIEIKSFTGPISKDRDAPVPEYALARELARAHGYIDALVIVAYGDPTDVAQKQSIISFGGLAPPDVFRKPSPLHAAARAAARQARFEHGATP